jgi:hypothetical protein
MKLGIEHPEQRIGRAGIGTVRSCNEFVDVRLHVPSWFADE